MLITNSDWKQYRGKKLSENDNDDEMFGSSERTKSFRGWTVQQVKDHFDELNSELYGYEAYWEDDNDPEFVRKENELKAMMQYARIRFGEDFYQYLSNWREYSDRQMARYDDRTKADPFNNTRYYGDPRITKAGKMHKQDQRVRAGNIKDRIGKHTPHELPESDESDDELFGAGGEKMYVVAAPDDEILGTFQNPDTAVAFAKKQIASYIEDGWGDLDTIKVYKQRLNDPDHGVPIAEFPITDDPLDESDDDDDLFATPRIRFGDFFNEHDEDELQAMGFSYGDDPEQDVDIINHYLEDGPVNWRVVKLIGAEDGQGDDIILHLDRSSRLGENDESDDDLFGVSGSAAQRMIYKFGKQMLAKLEQAYNDPHVKAQYEKLTQGEEPDANRLFDLVCRSTSTPFGKAIVVDTILREYAGGFSGLNDFGTLIDSGEWQHDIVEMWDMFGEDPDVAQQDWFQKEIQTFMGDR
jgi:hypothetical protein